jgi:hypothetical protein
VGFLVEDGPGDPLFPDRRLARGSRSGSRDAHAGGRRQAGGRACHRRTGGSPHTYPNPVRLGDDLYLFSSGTGFSATWSVSHDDGDTWSQAHSLFEIGSDHVRYIKYRLPVQALIS